MKLVLLAVLVAVTSSYLKSGICEWHRSGRPRRTYNLQCAQWHKCWSSIRYQIKLANEFIYFNHNTVFHAPFYSGHSSGGSKDKTKYEDILCKPSYVLKISPNFGKGEEATVKPGQIVGLKKYYRLQGNSTNYAS